MTITPLTVCLVIIITRKLLTAVLVHGILTLLLFLYTFCVAFDIVELIDNYNCNLRIICVSFSFTSTTTSHNSSNTHTKNSDSVAKNKMRSTKKKLLYIKQNMSDYYYAHKYFYIAKEGDNNEAAIIMIISAQRCSIAGNIIHSGKC